MMLSRKVIWYDFDDYRLDAETPRLLKNGVPVTLSPKSLQTLLVLVERAGETVEKDEIYKQLWTDSFVEEGNLTQHIYILRKNLGQSYIETVARHGYRFTAEVKTVHAEISVENQDKTQEPVQNGAGKSVSPVGGSKRGFSDSGVVLNGEKMPDENERSEETRNVLLAEKPKSQRSKWLFLALVLFVLVGAGSYVYLSNFSPRPAAGVSDQKIKSIAILPFKTIGDNGDAEHLGLGMTDAIITRLSKFKQIPVRPTSAIFRLVGTDTTPDSAGRALQVDAVLEGTIQHEGKWVRVSVQLVRVDTGETVWAENFDGEYTHIFKVQDTISEKIVDSLALNFSPNQEQNIKKRATENIEAYQAYTLGIYFWNKRTKEGLQKAEQYFRRAIELDPNYAQAYAGLADTYNMLVYNRFVPLEEVGEKAKTAALKAVELDDTVAEAHLALAQVQFSYEKNDEAGVKSLERAIELSPFNATAHLRYGWQMLSELRLDAAEREMRLAQEYDPLSPTPNLALCNILISARKYGEAVKFCERAVEIDRKTPGGLISLAEVYILTGKREQAVALASEEVSGNPDDLYAQAFLGYLYARAGNRKKAVEIADHVRIGVEKNPGLLIDLALIEYTAGRKDKALENLTAALEKKAFSRRAVVFDPKFDEMKADNLFSDLFLRHKLTLDQPPQ